MKKEEAKAVQEVAKTTHRAFDSVDAVGRFFEESLGYAIREAGGFLGDWVKFKRENWRIACEMAQATLDARGVEQIEAIPAKYGVAIIEKASLEDDELIQRMWAALIANSLDPSKETQPSKLILSLLGELEPIDAAVLDLLVVFSQCSDRFPKGELGSPDTVLSALDFDERSVRLSLLNLDRLSLIKNVVDSAEGIERSLYQMKNKSINSDGFTRMPSDVVYQLSDLGVALMEMTQLESRA